MHVNLFLEASHTPQFPHPSNGAFYLIKAPASLGMKEATISPDLNRSPPPIQAHQPACIIVNDGMPRVLYIQYVYSTVQYVVRVIFLVGMSTLTGNKQTVINPHASPGMRPLVPLGTAWLPDWLQKNGFFSYYSPPAPLLPRFLLSLSLYTNPDKQKLILHFWRFVIQLELVSSCFSFLSRYVYVWPFHWCLSLKEHSVKRMIFRDHSKFGWFYFKISLCCWSVFAMVVILWKRRTILVYKLNYSNKLGKRSWRRYQMVSLKV